MGAGHRGADLQVALYVGPGMNLSSGRSRWRTDKATYVAYALRSRDDDVALDALRPRRLAVRQLALGDTVGPVAEVLERHAAQDRGQRSEEHTSELQSLRHLVCR